MKSIWAAVGCTVLSMNILCLLIKFIKYSHCLVNRSVYEKRNETMYLPLACKEKTSEIIVIQSMVIPMSIIFCALAIVALVLEYSIYLIPWLVFYAMYEFHQYIVLNFIGTQKNLALNSLFLFECIAIWLLMYINYRKILIDET